MSHTHLHPCLKSPLVIWCLCHFVFLSVRMFSLYCSQCLFLVQSGSGGGVGAAAGTAGSSREGQCVLGAPWSRHHCTLLGHQRSQSFCR